jgi:hypothetical protein
VQHRWLVSIMSTLLLSCAGAVQERQTLIQPRAAKASVAANERGSMPDRKATATPARKPGPSAARDAKTAASSAPSSGATSARKPYGRPPAGSVAEQHSVAVQGIEGTMSEYDVRTTLESRGEDFDRCHERGRGGSGRIEFRIHILSTGEVGDVKAHRLNVHDSKLVDCYSDVVASSRFTSPHGGYADVTWTTKVGRSRPQPDDIFERRGRWDAPATSSQTESSSSRRERRHSRKH